MLQFNVVDLQALQIIVGNSVQHGRNMDRNFNAYASAEGVADLVALYRRALHEIRATAKRPPRMSSERDLQFAVVELVQECSRYKIAPPPDLAALVADLFKIGDETRRRARVRFPVAKAKRVKAETGLKGRALARELRSRGIHVSDRTLATHEKDL
jgi:hypothetical protein